MRGNYGLLSRWAEDIVTGHLYTADTIRTIPWLSVAHMIAKDTVGLFGAGALQIKNG